MTEKKGLARSLNARMLYMVVLGMLAAVAVYFAVNAMGGEMVRRVYMSEQNAASRKAQIHAEFVDFVRSNHISGRDTAAVARWTGEHENAAIIIYGLGSESIHVSGGKVSALGTVDPRQSGKLYLVSFKDGVYQIGVIDNSQTAQYRLVGIIALAAACLCFIIISLLYARDLSRRVIALSREAALVSSGELERCISAKGGDEIAALARSMDEMRRSVITRMGNESRAWQANSELITAISHDIRTPMTSMIGYLGLLSESDFEDKERCKQFADSAYGKAMELKYLTDELFRYFLVFGKSELQMDMETLDGRLLWEQLIGEAEFDMADAGLKVRRVDFEGECSVNADPMYLMRVLNNLVSNVKKYADPERVVMVISELKDGRLSLCMSNSIPAEAEKKESTKIGLMTCRKIIESMGGSFEARSDGEHFAAELSIPVI